MDKKTTKTIARGCMLAALFTIYSASMVFSKSASQQQVLSWTCLLYFGCALTSLFIYAILWQTVISEMSLTVAYLCKSSTLCMILILSAICFNESVTFNNIIGSILIFTGLIILVWK